MCSFFLRALLALTVFYPFFVHSQSNTNQYCSQHCKMKDGNFSNNSAEAGKQLECLVSCLKKNKSSTEKIEKSPLSIPQLAQQEAERRNVDGERQCNLIKSLTQYIREHIATGLGVPPDSIKLNRKSFNPLSVSDNAAAIHVGLKQGYSLKESGVYPSCRVVMYTPKGPVTCNVENAHWVLRTCVRGVVE